jgi:poly-gamma-glutamate capsule biosynthesis protein CapA/YwtB (metallophosphatase superfamily)
MNFGQEGLFDWLDLLKRNAIATVGAGVNLEEAHRPVIVERGGTRVGFLAYLSIIETELVIAEESIPGCATLRATTCYQQLDAQPGTPPLIITKLFDEEKKAMEEDIRKLRPQVDVLVVSMHCGVHNIPEIIAMYQKEAAYAAIDAGADLILQHHAHILKGIESYKGKAIFYSLGNFALEHSLFASRKLRPHRTWLTPLGGKMAAREFFGIKPVPGYEKHRYHFDSLKTVIAKAYIQDKKLQKVTYIPCYITPNLEPEVVTRKDPRAQEVFDYVASISDRQNLNVSFSWDGDEVLVGEAKG